MNRFLVTGASSGIGAAVASALLSRGLQVAVNARSEDKLRALGDSAVVFPGDLTAPGVAERVVRGAAEQMGGLDGVLHATGVGLIKPTADTTDAEFTRVMNVNTRTAFLVANEACRIFTAQKRGLFLTIPGVLGKAPMRNATAYVASKYAVTGMMKCLALEHQRNGVRFCLFHFGGVDTPFWNDIGMSVQRDKMIPVDTAVALILQAIDAPPHLALSEVVMQPDSHILV